MSFEDFRRNVEVSTDPALIERWKEEARTTTTISTVVPEGETPVVLNSPAEARAHFRQHHLDSLVGGVVLTPLVAIALSPLCTRKMLAERVIARSKQEVPTAAIPAEEKPSTLEPIAPPSTSAAGVPAAAASEPEEPGASDAETSPAESSTESAATVDTTAPAEPAPVGDAPAVQPPKTDAPTLAEDPAARAKAALAADLRFLVQSGHIIEFHNGTFDLPLPPRPKEEGKPQTSSGKQGLGNRQPQPTKTASPAPMQPGTSAPSSEPVEHQRGSPNSHSGTE